MIYYIFSNCILIMGLFKWFIDKFSCKSSCRFNIQEQMFDQNINKMCLGDFELKHKDILKIHTILNKRDIRPRYPNLSSV